MDSLLIQQYFKEGCSYNEILLYLKEIHNINISKITLKRKLRSLQLFRRKFHTDLLQAALFLVKQISSSGQGHGYRWMHLKCQQNGIHIPRNTVMKLLRILDPVGVCSRKEKKLRRRIYYSQGTDFVWHVDSYDKLKPFGIGINGCIDGFSRKRIWLEAHFTNSDPKVIANYFIMAVKKTKGCPQRIRADMGTENGLIEKLQVFLRRNHDDSFAAENSFLYGKSTHNQRIEWFWGILRKEMCQFWINFFKDLSSDGVDGFCGDILDKNLVRFCFMDIIQKELDELVYTWNSHKIRTEKGPFPGGSSPLLMYNFPELFDREKRLRPVTDAEIDVCEEVTTAKGVFSCDETVFRLCQLVMDENGWEMPMSAADGKTLYLNLRNQIKALIQ